ncbi:hypothetical protein A2U01_0095656, partial [Trifolium medium]|nr:hypothetical protein [Trifolium medium]
VVWVVGGVLFAGVCGCSVVSVE